MKNLASSILVVDSYDSFTHTLISYVEFLGADCVHWQNDSDELGKWVISPEKPRGIILAPGPGNPGDAGQLLEAVRTAITYQIPCFGVCLGHQALGEVFGSSTIQAKSLTHGKATAMHHVGTGIFERIPSPTPVGRYHSLAVEAEKLSQGVQILGTTEDGEVMAMQNVDSGCVSVQFHPESILTPYGFAMLGSWLENVGYEGAAQAGLKECTQRADEFIQLQGTPHE